MKWQQSKKPRIRNNAMYRKAVHFLDKDNFTNYYAEETKTIRTWQNIDMFDAMILYIEITSSLSCQLLNLDRG